MIILMVTRERILPASPNSAGTDCFSAAASVRSRCGEDGCTMSSAILMKRLTCAGDWDFWLRIADKYQFRHIPEFLGLYYHNEDGIEHGRKIHSLYERYLVGKRYGNPYISVIGLYQHKDNPLVSVILPAYNAANYIRAAIESVLIQNYRNFEMIVIDDGSTDNTKETVAGFKDDKIRYFYKENGGPASARNFGIKNAQRLFYSFSRCR